MNFSQPESAIGKFKIGRPSVLFAVLLAFTNDRQTDLPRYACVVRAAKCFLFMYIHHPKLTILYRTADARLCPKQLPPSLSYPPWQGLRGDGSLPPFWTEQAFYGN